MIFALNANCPLFAAGNELALHSVLLSIADRKHTLASPAPERLAQIVPGQLWEAFGEYVKQSYKLATRGRTSWVRPADCSKCDAPSLASYCSLTTIVLVENASTDGGFLRLVWTHSGPRCDDTS